MKKVIKKMLGVTMIVLGSATVAGVTTYTLMEQQQQTTVSIQPENGFSMPVALWSDKSGGQPVDLTVAAENSLHAVVHIKSTQLGKTQTVTQMPDLFDFF